ncbi:MAG: tRNA lysidine(34) synthetase TilS [Bacilli bacterium]
MVIVGVSGGVDSMVLLDLLYQSKAQIVVAHINYQKRSDSFKDYQAILDYVKDKDIIVHHKKVSEYDQSNFQAQARKIRYEYFMELGKQYQTKEIYVAHHADDYLETYVMKRQRQSLYRYYGLRKQEEFKDGYIINRILLSWTKQAIYQYAFKNNIPYHEDSSNNDLIYERNQVRASLSTYSQEDKDLLYEEALNYNDKLNQYYLIAHQSNQVVLMKDTFLNWNQTIQRYYLYYFIANYQITTKYLDELVRVIKTSQSNEIKIVKTNKLIYKNATHLFFHQRPYRIKPAYIKNDDDLKSYNESLKQYGVNIPLQGEYPFYIEALDAKQYLRMKTRIKKMKLPSFIKKNMIIIKKDDESKLLIDYIYL